MVDSVKGFAEVNQ